MKIVSLQAEGIKRIKAVHITPDGSSVVEITGKNRQGKTSILDAIFWAIADARHIQDVPINRDAEKAFIKLDLGRLKITRKFARKEDGDYTTQLKVENEDGALKSPQAILDALVSGLSFDPIAFASMKPEAQFDAVRRFVPAFDFVAMAEANKKDFADRTNINRRAKELRTQAEGITFETVAGGAKDETALVAKLETAGQHNADIERRRANREQAARDIADKKREAQACLDQDDEIKAQIDALITKREQLNAQAQAFAQEANELQAKLDAAGDLPAPIDTAEVREQIEAARAHNARLTRATEAAKRKADLERDAKAEEDKSAALTKAMETRDKEKLAAIKAAKMPVDGLSFGDGCVLMNGLPFDQASDAEQLEASIAIAAAMNPRLRVLRVRDGSKLDSDAMAALGKFAEQHDMQVWIETVQSGRVGAVVIEDGMVKADAEETEAA